MKFKIFVAVAVFAALTSTVSASTLAPNTVATYTTKAPTNATATNTTEAPTNATVKPSETSVTSSKTGTTTAPAGTSGSSRTTSPVSCKSGNCSGNPSCLNTLPNNACVSGKIYEVEVNNTYSNFTVKCEAPETCKQSKADRKPVCCAADSCKQGIAKAIADAKANAEANKKKSGCDTVRLNLNTVVAMAFILLLTL